MASTFPLVGTSAEAGTKEKREIQIETVGHSIVVPGTLESGDLRSHSGSVMYQLLDFEQIIL